MSRSFGPVSLKCPHCGFTNNVYLDADEIGAMQIFYCMIDEGGCDEPFAYKADAEITAEVYKINISKTENTKE